MDRKTDEYLSSLLVGSIPTLTRANKPKRKLKKKPWWKLVSISYPE